MKDKISYRELRVKLDEILLELENDQLDIDDAIVLHKKGQEVAEQMKKYLAEIGKTIKASAKDK